MVLALPGALYVSRILQLCFLYVSCEVRGEGVRVCDHGVDGVMNGKLGGCSCGVVWLTVTVMKVSSGFGGQDICVDQCMLAR